MQGFKITQWVLILAALAATANAQDTPSATAGTAPAQDDPCNVSDNMDAIRACMDGDNMRKVDASFARVRKTIAAKDVQAAAQLDSAQQAWRAYMKASCDYSATAAPEGMYDDDARSQCIDALAQARVRILDAYGREFRKLPQH